ncbi:MAG: LysR substrate-binding domain-containing protein [Rhodocyclaceae bacterium]
MKSARKPPDLDLDLLRTFVAVTQARGLASAGVLLGRGAPAIALRIRKLEERLGHALLRRCGRILVPSRHGEVLLDYARRILSLAEEGARALRASGVSGEVRLGVTEYFFPHCLPEAIARFARNQPELAIAVRTGLTLDLLRLQREGALDLVIGLRTPAAREGRIMFREPLCWVARRGFELQRAESVPLLALTEPCLYRAAATDALARAGRAWQVRYTANSVLALQAAVAGGLGVACLPLSSVQANMRVLGSHEGLPVLADCDLAVFAGAHAQGDRIDRLIELVRLGLPILSVEVMRAGGGLEAAA